MSSTTYKYFSNPKVNISIPTADLTYAIVSCKGNTIATSGNIISGNITGGIYTTPDLSFNTLYTITITPYGVTGIAGTSQTLTIDTTPKLSGSKSAQKSTMALTNIYASKTSNNFTISRSAGTSDASDISTNITTTASPHYDTDLSGNTLYYYYIKQYNASGVLTETTSPINSVYVNVRAPTDMSYSYFDSSAASFTWKNTKNSYNTSYYNSLIAVPTSGVGKTTVSMTPFYTDITSYTLTGLTNSTTYNCYVQTYLLSAATSTVTATTATPAMSTVYMTELSMNSVKVSWSGTYVDNFIVYRKIGALSYVDVSYVASSPYSDTDISGNTTYYYYITPRSGVFSGSASSVVSGTTPVAYPTDVSASFYDASAIQLNFTAPRNSYTSYYYYTATAVYGGNTYSMTSTASPILIQNLSGATTYSCYINVVVDGYYTGTSSTLSVTTKSSTTTYTQSFTTITSFGTPASIPFGSASAYDPGLGANPHVSVDYTQTKMLLTVGTWSSSASLYYSTYNGSYWSTPVAIANSSLNYSAIALAACGTVGVAAVGYSGATYAYCILWSGSTPTIQSFSTSITSNFDACSISPDGTKCFFTGTSNQTLYYSTFNSSTNNFNTFTTYSISSGSMPTQVGGLYVAWTSTPYVGTIANSGFGMYYINSSFTTISSITGGSSIDSRGSAFVGGGDSGSPTYVFIGNSGGKIYYGKYNTTTNTVTGLTTITEVSNITTSSGNMWVDIGSFSNGKNLYFSKWGSNYVYKMAINAT